MSKLIDTIKPGDRVTIVDRFGHERTGRAVMPSSHGGWVLNMGGKHGTPGIADDRNVTKVVKRKKPTYLGSAPRFSFEELPVGSCFAFDVNAKKPTRRKVGDRHTVMLPDGQRKMAVSDVDTKVSVLPCNIGLGRGRRRR